MKVLVCGGRDFQDQSWLRDWLDHLHAMFRVTTVIAGCANGADRLAALWGYDRNLTVKDYPANWDAHGKAAGPIRNQKMLDEGQPDLVVAFPGGRGTKDMMTRARRAGVRVIEIPPRTPQAKENDK